MYHLRYRKKTSVFEGRGAVSQGSWWEREAGLDHAGFGISLGVKISFQISWRGSLEGFKQKSGSGSGIICFLEGKALPDPVPHLE